MAPERTELLPGVRAIEHTADLGLDIEAPTLPELFHRAAAGMFMLVLGREEAGEAEADQAPGEAPSAGNADTVRSLSLSAVDLPALLVAWLRELLYLHQVEELTYASADFETLDEAGSLKAQVKLAPASPETVREIKGVTYHQLAVVRQDGGWRARVVFDV
ncbi:MAG: archease [Gemmatimonadota bacterium]